MIFKLFVASMVAVSVSFGTTCYRPSNKIKTEPVLVQNTLAKNFNGLKLSTKFLYHDDYYSWYRSGFIPSQIFIFTQFLPCANRIERDIQVTCEKVLCKGSTYIITSLTLMYPFDRNVTFSVTGVGTNQLASIDIKVKGCSIGPGRSLEVDSQSTDYNAVGEFRCRNGGVLFYSNKTRLDSTKTKCLATAQWKDSNTVQCWTAPSEVSVAGSLTVTEGNDINLKCKHQSGFPASNGSLFLFKDATTYVKEDGNFTIKNVKMPVHNQSISCQVQSPYVAFFDQLSGRSQLRFINVLCMTYNQTPLIWTTLLRHKINHKDRPYTSSLQLCTWEVNATGICNVSFQSNPLAQFSSILFNGNDVTVTYDLYNLVGSSTTQQYFMFIREQVDISFAGFYELVLYSNVFGETKISFQIDIVNQLTTTQLSALFRPKPLLGIPDFTLIGLSIGIVFSVISIILTIIYWRERYCLKG